jgi:DHA3 family macrolide efflux protein-like MFS transporter
LSVLGRRRAPSALVKLWVAQAISLLISGATTISLSLWVYEQSRSAVELSVIVAVKTAVSVFASPLVGAVSDRRSRRTLIILGNLGLILPIAALAWWTSEPGRPFALLAAILVVTGILESLVTLSMTASVRDVRAERDLTRVNGIVSLLESAPLVVAPVFGALAFTAFGIHTVLILDAASFVVAALMTLATHWDSPSRPARSRLPFAGATSGLSLLWRHPDFRALQIGFSLTNICNGLAVTGVTTFVLAGSQQSSTVLGVYNACSAVGLVAGSAVVAAIGTRLDRVLAIHWGTVASGLGGRVLLALTPLSGVWFVSAAVRSVGLQISNAALTAIWQEATAREHQGKVFGARRLLGQGAYPFAVLVGGVAADRLAGRGQAVAGLPGPSALGIWLAILGVTEAVIVTRIRSSGVLREVARPAVVFAQEEPQ